MSTEKVTVRMLECPECGRTVPVEKLPSNPAREHGPLTRVLFYARHLWDRTALDQKLCRNSNRIASITDGMDVAA